MNEGETPETERPGWRSLTGRLSAALMKPGRPPTMSPGGGGPGAASDMEKRRAILSLDPLERKIGLLGAALAALLAMITTLPYVANPKTKVTVAAKGRVCPVDFHYQSAAKNCLGAYARSHWVFEFGVLILFAAALFVTVRIGRRGAAGFTALMAGLAFETEVGILGLPFIAAGGWLLIRAWRVQRYGSPTATKANPSGERRAPPPRAERPTREKRTKTTQKRGPVPSKRYTPKSSKRRRPTATPPQS